MQAQLGLQHEGPLPTRGVQSFNGSRLDHGNASLTAFKRSAIRGPILPPLLAPNSAPAPVPAVVGLPIVIIPGFITTQLEHKDG